MLSDDFDWDLYFRCLPPEDYIKVMEDGCIGMSLGELEELLERE